MLQLLPINKQIPFTYICILKISGEGFVMNLQVLLNRFQSDNRVKAIAERIAMNKPMALRATNLLGSAPQFLLAAVYQQPKTALLNHIVVVDSAEEAAYFQNTLENLTNALDIYYFPASFKHHKNFRLLNSSHVMLRTETLTRWSLPGNRRIMVTYPEALFEKVVLPKTLSQNIILIKTNDVIDTVALMDKFVSYGFERTDFVYEPGQFAMRGGILDIYSFGNDKPYRVELFGNDVDSIRIFDPETQLSERKLLQVTIIPNVETHFEDELKTSLPEFLPENTVWWIKDRELLNDKLQVQEEDLALFLERNAGSYSDHSTEEDMEKVNVGANDFTTAAFTHDFINTKRVIEFGSETGKSRNTYQPSESFVFNSKPQPSFNRQFDLLIKDLTGYEKQVCNIFICR